MGRHERLGPSGIAQHIIQRGNNRRACFACEQDYINYVAWLKEYSAKFNVAIHAWVLMTNHVHLLCTPMEENFGVSRMMQALGRKYVRYFNDTKKRTGTLFEGRFKSTLVCTTSYLLVLYRYIELNPVRANMVDGPSDYKWSSYVVNALGKASDLCRPHPLYTELGASEAERQFVYRRLFDEELDQSLIEKIRTFTQKELVLGDDKFKADVELLLDCKLKREKLGRPEKIKEL